MAFDWTICHEAQLITATVSGEAKAQDFAGFFAGVTEAGALPYRKIVDIRFAMLEVHLAEVKAFGRSIVEAGKTMKIGPTAIIASSEIAREFAHAFEENAHTDRPLRTFATVEKGRAWLDEVAPVVNS